MRIAEAYELGMVSDNMLMSLGMLKADDNGEIYLDTKCKYCGEELHITDNLVHLKCTNKRCKIKIANRLEEMAKELKVDGWGIATCLKVVNEYDMISPYQVLLIGDDEKSDMLGIVDKVYKLKKELNSGLKMWEIIKLGGFSGIKGIAYKLFNGYSDIEKAYNDINDREILYVVDKLNLSGNSMVLANKVYRTLREYESEIKWVMKNINVNKATDGIVIKIAITDNVYWHGEKMTKGEFVRALNIEFDGKYSIIFNNTVSKDTDYLVNDTGSTHGKTVKAMKLISLGEKIKIVTSDELESILEENNE